MRYSQPGAVRELLVEVAWSSFELMSWTGPRSPTTRAGMAQGGYASRQVPLGAALDADLQGDASVGGGAADANRAAPGRIPPSRPTFPCRRPPSSSW
jgi:hypothetical protein